MHILLLKSAILMCCVSATSVCVDCGFRWRNSFLFSLIFGIPAMIVMIFSMASMSWVTCPADNSDSNTSTVNVITATESSENCGSHTVMLLPGLSLENLLLFLLCTPCQVRRCVTEDIQC